jgi:hypothetical protein
MVGSAGIAQGAVTGSDPTASRSGGAKTDITNTKEGSDYIAASLGNLQKAGHAYAAADLAAAKYAGGDVIVGPRAKGVVDLRAEASGYRATVQGVPGEGARVASVGAVAVAPSFQPWSDDCFILWRTTSHFDVCYRMYWVANDGVAGKDYWRIDMYGTVFTGTGRTVDWAWLTVDQDAGPLQSYVAWDPTSDGSNTACDSETLNATVLGAGYSWSYSKCELWDISKSGTTTMGYFKNQWSWGSVPAKKDLDRGVALTLDSKGNSGAITYGISWNFAEH